MKQAQHGFTLMEVLIVTAIIAILGTVAVVGYQEYTARAKAAELLLQYDALRTGALARLSQVTTDNCDRLASALNNNVPVNSQHVALGYGFEAVSGGYRPVLTVCAKTDPNYPQAVRVARGAHDTMAKTGDKVSPGAVLTDSAVSFALRLTDGDRAVCKTAPSTAPANCDTAASAQAAASPQRVANKQPVQQSLQDKQAAHQAEQARQEAAARAQAEVMQRRQQGLLTLAEAHAKKGRHADAETARAAAAQAEQQRRASEAAAQAAAAAALAQACPDGQIRDGTTRQCRELVCTEEVVQPPSTSGFQVLSAANFGNLYPNPPPSTPFPPLPLERDLIKQTNSDGTTRIVGARGAECVLCGNEALNESCTQLDFMFVDTATCPDAQPVCLSRVTLEAVDDPRIFQRCASIGEAKAATQAASNGCVDGQFNVHPIPGATCARSCYGDRCNEGLMPGSSTVGTTRLVCK